MNRNLTESLNEGLSFIDDITTDLQSLRDDMKRCGDIMTQEELLGELDYFSERINDILKILE